ncbi:FecR family protein [Pedobacter sp. ok626]|uniref:FecR family protein n=1 Tax=Pedobacter sp. ok626 TaxID=1761882 RepID=UPI0008809975|nr:FecR family protein [Pedobacter sp. ok626]SDK65295.1 FecR family protein [Pedobacter sp. ok626]
MLEQEFHISKLITAELEGALDPERGRELQAWKDASPDHLDFYNRLVAQDNFLQEFKNFNETDTSNIWQLTAAGLASGMAQESRKASGKSIKLWPRIAGVAAAVAVLAICVYFFVAPDRSKNQIEYAKDHVDIQPGRKGATITLGNGKVIRLSELQSGVSVGADRLAYADGTSVDKGADVELKNQTLTASTANGQTYTFTLSDGTKVWLNAGSKISFAQQFINTTRDVLVEGEAYFEVAKDKHHPFIVRTKGQQIEVLGTHFNVNSYHDEPGTATTLLEGSVKISAGNVQKIIKPGEQAINRSGMIAVREIDVENYVDWKNGDFNLNHIEFKTAMRKIARWYDMEIIYDASVPDNMESGGWISRDKPLSTVLKSIESSGLVKFKVTGKKIYVMQ